MPRNKSEQRNWKKDTWVNVKEHCLHKTMIINTNLECPCWSTHIMYFIISWPLNACHFNILLDEMLDTKVLWLSPRLWVTNWTSHFFYRYHFHLKELTNCNYSCLDIWYFLENKLNKFITSMKKTTIFVASDAFSNFKEIWILEKFYLPSIP